MLSVEHGKPANPLRDTLRRHRLEALERDIAAAIGSYLDDHAGQLDPDATDEPLTAAERAALQSVGVDPTGPGDPAPRLKVAAAHAVLRGTAVPLAQAAARLGVEPSRLRQRIAEGSLLGVRLADGRSWGIPAFQLTPDAELPGLRQVMRAAAPGLSAVAIDAFFNTPNVDLVDDAGAPTSPVDWLRAGGDPEPVARLAADI